MNLFYFFAIICTFALTKEAKAAEKYKYAGCYENNDKTKLLNQFKTNDDKLTPTSCVDICHSKKLAFAALEGNQCRCGNNQPPELIRRIDAGCNTPCPGDPSLKCGGESKASIYETGIVATGEHAIPAKIYLGCYKDDVPEFRILKGSSGEFSDNSPTNCHKLCYKQGFRFFGLTYIKECWCGDTAPSEEIAISDDECNTRCSGDNNEFCGGGWRLSLYSTGITDIPEQGRYVGCFKNANSGEIKADLTLNFTKSNSNRRCMNVCDQKGFKYSGVQKGSQCICMDENPPAVFREDDYACNMDKCPGEVTEKCGSKDKMKIFKTRHADEIKTRDYTYLGCYKDNEGFRILDESKEVFENNLAPKLCIETCRLRGFAYSGVEFGKECFCSHKFPPVYAKAGEDECNTPCPNNNNERCGGPLRISVYDNGIPHPHAYVHSWYEGCFRDDDKDNRMLKGAWQELTNNSPDICHKLCMNKGYTYFGLTWIKECFCGDETPSDELILSDDECSKECGGDSTKKCGGGWRLSVYRTGLTDVEIEGNYRGCYRNNGTLLTARKAEMSTSLNPRRCHNICDMLGFQYSGLERGIECRCGDHFPSNLATEDDSKCSTKCPGNTADTCGKKNYVKVYRTSVPESEPTLSIGGLPPMKPGCVTSATSVNGRRTCSEKLIFSENFDTLNTSIWSHTIKMAYDPDYEFLTYTSAQDVVYIKPAKLFIKPKIQPDSFIRSSVTLNDCTGTAGSVECTRTAQSFNILPPVLSGQISTRNSFSFRYGRIQVKAKLPLGDWVVPEIWLTPKENFYGEYYQSGKIRIAVLRGNKALKCGSDQLGHKTLEVGIYLGPQLAIKQKVFHKEISDSWTYKYHNYTVIWTPDDILFQVDGENISSVMSNPEQTIRQAAGLPSNNEYIYKDGTKLAPFDKEFYITLGVSVGGVTDFPDTCISDGQKKPWSNSSPKAMLNFWERREQWKKSWLDERVALQVEHVKVYAI